MSDEGVILIVRDGWGFRESNKLNAISEAETPVDDELRRDYPHTTLKASGPAVGLPDNFQGNSEVGHLTIGSGRIIDQELTKINKAIKDKSFFRKEEFLEAIERAKENDSKLHLLGLIQKEGVHSHLNHLYALLDLCKKHGFQDVFIHVFTDGRDAPVDRGKKYLSELVDKLNDLGFGEIVTVSGRYYAMDRDRRWERTEKAYRAIMDGESQDDFSDPVKEVENCYQNEETDEFIIPRVKIDYQGVERGDSLIFFNFRTDRPRQLTQAIVEDNFEEFERNKKNIFFVAMTDYYRPFNGQVAFKNEKVENFLGEIISEHGLSQLRISETEKYAHVTFFFNGQIEEALNKESRRIISSPDVDYYDEKPEMSVFEIADKLVKEIANREHDFIVVNLVNCDMVGHTGDPEAIKKAVEAVDSATGQIVDAGLKNNYTLLITADHGNAEDQTEDWKTSHTINPVPFYLISQKEDLKNAKLKEGKGLKDIAPTVLKLFKIEKPAEMTGEDIVDYS